MPVRPVSFVTFLAATSTFAAEAPPKREPNRSPAETARIVRSLESEFRAIMERQKVPGVAIAVVKDDQVVYLKGFGYRNLEKKLPFTPDTICQIASCSKAFCSTTAVMAAAEGKLDLDASPRTLLPTFHLLDPDADRRITIADLMNHTFGLPRTDTAWWSSRIDAREASALLGQGEPTFPFRYTSQYSNMGVETAGLAVAAAFGKPWEEVVRERITEPLGMKSTWRRAVPEREPERVAVGYYVDHLGQIKPEPFGFWPALGAAGGMESTARDLAQWLRFHLGRGAVDGKRLVPERWLEEAHRGRFVLGGPTSVGLGWYRTTLRGVDQLNHSGYMPGFETRIDFVPAYGLGIAVVSNNAGRNAPAPIILTLLDHLVGKPDLREVRRVQKLGGTYFSSDGAHVAWVDPNNLEIEIMLDDARPVRFKATSANQFETLDPRDAKTTVTFSDDPKRKGKKRFTFSRANVSWSFAVEPERFHVDVSARELLRQTADRIGSTTNRVLECRFTARYASDAVDAIGVLYRKPTGYFGTLEQDWALGRPIMWSQAGYSPARSTVSDDATRVDEATISPRLLAFLNGYCNERLGAGAFAKATIVGEVDWTSERAYMVRLVTPDGAEMIEFIGKATRLPVRRQIGRALAETYSEYVGVDGVQVPMRWTTRDGNLAETRYQITSAKLLDRDVHWAFEATPFEGFTKPRYPNP